MASKLDELDEILCKLDSEGLREVELYAKTKLVFHSLELEKEYFFLKPENWSRVPWWLKTKIFIIVTWYAIIRWEGWLWWSRGNARKDL